MNFSRAAEELFIAQSAISRHISQLETELDVRLFKRRGKTIQLTSEGKDYYYYFTEITVKYNELRQKHQFHKAGDKTLLKYSSFPSWYISDVLLQNAEELKSKHDHIEPSMTFTKADNLLADLQNGVIDMLFHIASVFSNTPGFRTEKIIEIPNVIVFSEKHPLAQKNELTPMDFRNEVFIYVVDKTTTTPSMKKSLNSFNDCYGFFPRVKEVPDVDSLYFMVESIQGVALMDSWCRMKLNSKIRSLKTDFNETIVLAWSENNTNPVIPTFVEETREFFRTRDE
jgi:DNA-binding transcriptional LysR family regulator